jgi:Zn finger protein HypA/HybF involved in hydrogenase expression
MHEVSLVERLVEAAGEHAAGRPVAAIRVRHATTIPEPVLRQAFEMLTVTGPLAGSTLETEPFDIRLRCDCGFDGALGHDDVVGPTMAICPSCSTLSDLPRTAELELVEVRARG